MNKVCHSEFEKAPVVVSSVVWALDILYMLRDYSPDSLDNTTSIVEDAWKKARDEELGLVASCVERRPTIPSPTQLKILRFCLSRVKDEKGRAVKVCAGCKSCDATMEYKKTTSTWGSRTDASSSDEEDDTVAKVVEKFKQCFDHIVGPNLRKNEHFETVFTHLAAAVRRRVTQNTSDVSGRQQIQAVVPRLDGARRAGRKKSSGDEEDGHRSDNSESEEFSYDDKSEECSLETEGRAADIDRSVQLIMDEKARCSHALRELHVSTHQAIMCAAKVCYTSITLKQMYNRGAIDRGDAEARKINFLVQYINFEYERVLEERQYIEIPQDLLGSWIHLYNRVW